MSQKPNQISFLENFEEFCDSVEFVLLSPLRIQTNQLLLNVFAIMFGSVIIILLSLISFILICSGSGPVILLTIFHVFERLSVNLRAKYLEQFNNI